MMRNIIYYVASSLDGFMAGPGGDVSGFLTAGPGVDAYLNDLQGFDTVIMGRKTYEFGYQHGLQPGQPAYPHMRHHIFSSSLAFERPHKQVEVHPLQPSILHQLKAEAGSDIYLCGGGMFAGWLLEQGLIDQIKLKLNPVILGGGIPLFGHTSRRVRLLLRDRRSFPDGLQLLTYAIPFSPTRSHRYSSALYGAPSGRWPQSNRMR